jgi:Purple acid Phosphatase, N-terminal domain
MSLDTARKLRQASIIFPLPVTIFSEAGAQSHLDRANAAWSWGFSLIISAISVSSITQTSATITWTTDRAADSLVQYGLTTAYGTSTPTDLTLTTSHSVTITGLAPGTYYHFRVRSRYADETVFSADYTFETLADLHLPDLGTIVSIFLDSGRRDLSHEGISTATGWCEDRLLDIGDIRREISVLSGELVVSDVRVTIDNSDLAWSSLKSFEPFHNRILQIQYGDFGGGAGTFIVVFTGKITDWEFGENTLVLTARDVTYDILNSQLSGVLDAATFPNLPPTTPPVLQPIVMGQVSNADTAATGACPCYLIDDTGPFRYLVARHLCNRVAQVYRYGVLLDPDSYDVTTAVYGGVTMTVIDFDADPRDAERSNEMEITANVAGYIALLGGDVLNNPVWQLRSYLMLYAGLDSDDFDTDLVAAAAAAIDSWSGFVVSGESISHAEVVHWVCTSFNLSFFTTRAGKFALYQQPQAAVLRDCPTVTDELDIVRGSFKSRSQREVASGLSVSFRKNFATGVYELVTEYNDADQETKLAERIVPPIEFVCIRDPVVAEQMAFDRLRYLRENTHTVEFTLPVSFFSLDLNNLIKITHREGYSDSYSATGMDRIAHRIIGLTLSLGGPSLGISVTALQVDIWDLEYLVEIAPEDAVYVCISESSAPAYEVEGLNDGVADLLVADGWQCFTIPSLDPYP